MTGEPPQSNPYGMDEECRNCPTLVETRSRVVHGYGDVEADLIVIGEAPSAGADSMGVPFAGEVDVILEMLADLDRCDTSGEEPELENAYLTLLTRCHHPDRAPTDDEVRNCEPFLTGDVRTINPELIVPVGQRVLEALATEYTTRNSADLDVEEVHASSIRGRGFEIVPCVAPESLTDAEREAFLEHLSSLLSGDYRQTKGQRER